MVHQRRGHYCAHAVSTVFVSLLLASAAAQNQTAGNTTTALTASYSTGDGALVVLVNALFAAVTGMAQSFQIMVVIISTGAARPAPTPIYSPAAPQQSPADISDVHASPALRSPAPPAQRSPSPTSNPRTSSPVAAARPAMPPARLPPAPAPAPQMPLRMSNQGATRTIVRGATISDGYALPLDKQGVHDQRYMLTFNINQGRVQDRNDRYDAYMNAVQPGVKRYNVFWYAIEKSNVAPSANPITCPKEFVMVPSSQAEKVAKGYNRFHCYHYAEIADMASYLALDASRGIESVATIWGTPALLRDPGCVGFKINGAWTYNSCVPRDDTMPDYADFVNFLASTWNDDVHGRFKHWIIWNEVANADWFDTSPTYNVTKFPTQADVDTWIDKYVALLKLSHDTIQRHFKGRSPAMMYVSLDRIYKPPSKCPPTGFQHCHIGGSQMLQGIWDRINITMDWSVAVHPYGDPNKSDWDQYGMYTFADLHYVIDDQLKNLAKYGVTDPTRAPQAMLAASEQGWHGEGALAVGEANNVCVAHSVATNYTNLIWVTHNDFQGVVPNDYPGFVPVDAWLNLTGAANSSVFSAYKATSRNSWNVEPTNWCCQQLNLGCPIASPAGPVSLV